MNLHYKILWIEDQQSFIGAHKERMERGIREMGFLPQVVLCSTSDDITPELSDPTYDLILLDYKLGEGTYGTTFAQKARELEVYTEIVMYSARYAELRNQLARDPIQGIYHIDREDFHGEINKILRHIVKKQLDLDSFRGVFLSEMASIEGDVKEMLLRLPNFCEQFHRFDLGFALNGHIEQRQGEMEEKLNRLQRASGLGDKVGKWSDCCFSTSMSRYETVCKFVNAFQLQIGTRAPHNSTFGPLKKMRDKLAHYPNEEEVALGRDNLTETERRESLLQLCSFSSEFNNMVQSLNAFLDAPHLDEEDYGFSDEQ